MHGRAPSSGVAGSAAAAGSRYWLDNLCMEMRCQSGPSSASSSAVALEPGHAVSSTASLQKTDVVSMTTASIAPSLVQAVHVLICISISKPSAVSQIPDTTSTHEPKPKQSHQMLYLPKCLIGTDPSHILSPAPTIQNVVYLFTTL